MIATLEVSCHRSDLLKTAPPSPEVKRVPHPEPGSVGPRACGTASRRRRRWRCFTEGKGVSPVKVRPQRRSHCLGRRTVTRSEAFSMPLTEWGSPVGR
jgi:hypothetical protein